MKIAIENRFWDKVEIKGDNDCWPWKAKSKDTHGYGSIYDGRCKKLRRAHIIAYELANGDKIESGFVIMHTCDNPPCCNPRHLRKGTMKDNTHDMIFKNRGGKPPHYNGEKNPKAKLTRENVLQIRELIKSGKSQRKIAAIFGVNRGSISCIYSGRNWKWLKEESENVNSNR